MKALPAPRPGPPVIYFRPVLLELENRLAPACAILHGDPGDATGDGNTSDDKGTTQPVLTTPVNHILPIYHGGPIGNPVTPPTEDDNSSDGSTGDDSGWDDSGDDPGWDDSGDGSTDDGTVIDDSGDDSSGWDDTGWEDNGDPTEGSGNDGGEVTPIWCDGGIYNTMDGDANSPGTDGY